MRIVGGRTFVHREVAPLLVPFESIGLFKTLFLCTSKIGFLNKNRRSLLKCLVPILECRLEIENLER